MHSEFGRSVAKDRNQWIDVWRRFRLGDRFAFSEIYEEFADILFAYGVKITNDRELVKDCIQDLFFNIYRYNIKLQQPEYLEFYLFRSLKNDLIRKVKSKKQQSSLSDENVVLFDLKFLAEHDNPEPESEELRIEALQKILQTISPQKREMLFLKFSTGLNYAEIGEIVGMKADAVKKQVYRTLDDLRDRFGNKLLSLLSVFVKG